MNKPKVEITAETITNVIQEGKLTSLTQVSKALGLGTGSVSGSVAKRLRELVPNVAELLAANKPAKDATPSPAYRAILGFRTIRRMIRHFKGTILGRFARRF